MLVLEHVRAVLVDLGHRRVERDRDLVAGHVAGGANAVHQHVECLGVGAEIGRKAALVADRGAMPLVVKDLLEAVEHLDCHPQSLAERPRPDRHDHELLEVDRVVGVGAAVEHVHHRYGQDVGALPAEVSPQRLALLGGRRVGRGERHRQDRVRAQPGLVRGAVEGDQHPIERRLGARVLTPDGGRDLAVDVVDRLGDTLAHPVRPSVPELGGLELPGRRPGRDGGAAPRTRANAQFHLDRRIAAAVKDLSGVNVFDLAHVCSGPPGVTRARARA